MNFEDFLLTKVVGIHQRYISNFPLVKFEARTHLSSLSWRPYTGNREGGFQCQETENCGNICIFLVIKFNKTLLAISMVSHAKVSGSRSLPGVVNIYTDSR